MHNKRIVFFIVVLVLIFLPGFVFSASPKKSSPKLTSMPAPSIIPSKTPSKVTVTRIKYTGPKSSMTVAAIQYTGPNPEITVFAIKYTGKTLQSSIRSVSKQYAKKQSKVGTIKPTLLPSARKIYSVGAIIPLKVSMFTKKKENVIFQFEKLNRKQWQKTGHQLLGSPRAAKSFKKIVLTQNTKLMQSGKYRWRCSADKGQSWSGWSEILEVIKPGVRKAPKLKPMNIPARRSIIDLGEE